jgi:glycosyltransferase involved in cell wall biosynthesis
MLELVGDDLAVTNETTRRGYDELVTQPPSPRFGVDARWWTAGPPSGRNYVRHLLAEFGAGPDATDYVAFVRGRSAGDSGGVVPIRAVSLPSMPAVIFNSVAIPARLPASVRSVVYQNFTPPISRAGSVTIVHDLIFFTHPEYFGRAERLYLSLIGRLLPRATIVAAVSAHVRDEILERWPGRDPASVIVAPNGIDDGILNAASSAGDQNADPLVLARLRVSQPYVLYLGRLNIRKNLARLMSAFAAAQLSDHQLVLAGPPDSSGGDLAAHAARQGLVDRVRFTGRIADADLPALLRNADAFAYVSLEEGFGVPPLEAMAFGVPVLCSDIPALRETAADGGALFADAHHVDSIAQGLTRAVNDETFRTTARALGPAHARQYRWRAAALAVHDALERAST